MTPPINIINDNFTYNVNKWPHNKQNSNAKKYIRYNFYFWLFRCFCNTPLFQVMLSREEGGSSFWRWRWHSSHCSIFCSYLQYLVLVHGGVGHYKYHGGRRRRWRRRRRRRSVTYWCHWLLTLDVHCCALMITLHFCMNHNMVGIRWLLSGFCLQCV